jgi:4-amino-4-deoxy-L-arabinose transferase-like glycosyltransferase
MRQLEDFLDADSSGRRRVRFIVVLLAIALVCLLWVPAVQQASQVAWYQLVTQRQLNEQDQAEYQWCHSRTADYIESHPFWNQLGPCPDLHSRSADAVNAFNRAVAVKRVGTELSRPLRITFVVVVIAFATWFALPRRRERTRNNEEPTHLHT